MKFTINFGDVSTTVTINNAALSAAIVSFDDWNTLRDGLYGGESLDNTNPIWGDEAMEAAKADGLTISGAPLLAECKYVFRIALSGKLVPLRTTMHPKTMANLYKGSRAFGSTAIYNEL